MSKESTVLTLTFDLIEGTFTSDKQKGSGYHMISDGLHTFVVAFSNWTGELTIQATLAVEPAETDWFTIDLTNADGTPRVFGDGSTDYDDSYAVHAEGNFVWIRAVGSGNPGEITEIRYNY